MQVRLFGFNVAIEGITTFSQLFDDLRGSNGQKFKFANHDRVLHVSENGHYYVGLFLTLKDQRAFTELSKGRITVRKLKGEMCDFNFFVVDRRSMRGLYQHYHHSCSVNQFGLFLKRRYDTLHEKARDAAIKALGEAATEKQKAIVRRQYQARLESSTLWRKESFQKMLEQLKTVSLFQFDLNVLTDDGGLFTPLRPFAKSEKHTIRFTHVSAGAIAKLLTDLVIKNHLGRGRVIGEDQDGVERIINLVNTPDIFAEMSYDDVTQDQGFDLENLKDCPLIQEMIVIMKKHPKAFEAEVTK